MEVERIIILSLENSRGFYRGGKKKKFIQTGGDKNVEEGMRKKSWGIKQSHMAGETNEVMHSLEGNKGHQIRLGMWNCGKKLFLPNNEPSHKFKEAMEYINTNKLDMLAIIESNLRMEKINKEDISLAVTLPNFRVVLPDSWDVHGVARILILVKTSLNVEIMKTGTISNDLPTVTMKVRISRREMLMVNFFYREFTGGVSGLKNQGAQLERLKRQVKVWQKMAGGGKDFVIMGDANVCALKWKEDASEKKEIGDEIKDFLNESGAEQLVKEVTRTGNNMHGDWVGSCIDHIYSDVEEKIKNIKVEAVGQSDHLGISLSVKTQMGAMKRKNIQYRDYSRCDIGVFLTELWQRDVNNKVAAEDDIEKMAEIFETELREVLDKHAPVKTQAIKNGSNASISDRTRIMIMMRRSMMKKAVEYRSQALRAEARKLNKRIKKSIKDDEEEFYRKHLDMKEDSKRAWKTAMRMVGGEKDLAPSRIEIRDDTRGDGKRVIEDPSEMAEVFNEFFTEKVKKLRMKTDTIPKIPPEIRLQRWLENRGKSIERFSLRMIDRMTFRHIMGEMKNSKTHGWDWLDSSILKIVSPILEDSMISLINKSLLTGIFPTRWKPLLIYPNHKKKEKEKIENYRPVAHIVQIGLVVERAASRQILDHFYRNDLFHDSHHGGLKNLSTATALIRLQDSWICAAEGRLMNGTILLDQSSAYDLTCHATVKKKLHLYNFDETAVSWVDSYLTGRGQIVQIEDKQSRMIPGSDHGGPQGSIMAGIFHIVNTNDVAESHEEAESVIFIDDISSNTVDDDPDRLKERMEREAQLVVDYLRDNKLSVSGEKSKIITMGTSQLANRKEWSDIEVEIDGARIKNSTSESLLGLTISNDLSWNKYLNGTGNKGGMMNQLRRRLGWMRKLSRYMDTPGLRTLAEGLILSKIRYCLGVYGAVFDIDVYDEDSSQGRSFTRKNLRDLQVIQNSAARMITKLLRATSTKILMEKTGWLAIHQEIAKVRILQLLTMLSEGKPDKLVRKVRNDLSDARMRNIPEVKPPSYRLSSSRQGFLYQACHLVNLWGKTVMDYMEKKEIKRGYMTKKETKMCVISWVKNNISTRPESKGAGRSRRRKKTVAEPINEEQDDGETSPPETNIRRRIMQPDIRSFFPPDLDEQEERHRNDEYNKGDIRRYLRTPSQGRACGQPYWRRGRPPEPGRSARRGP